MTNSNSRNQLPRDTIQTQRFEADREAYGDHQEGTYEGLRWVARRPVPHMLHWNGYVELPRELLDDQMAELDTLSHGGITGGYQLDDGTQLVGFDTAHYMDFMPTSPCSVNMVGIYRDFPYVKSILETMIDYLVTLNNKRLKIS